MKIAYLLILLAAASLVIFASCNRKAKTTLDANTKKFDLSEEVSLALDEKAATDDGRFQLKALSIKDSRCPKGVQCIRAGEVFVELWLKTDKKEETLKMATPSTRKMGGMDEITFDGYVVKLENVLPYPVSPKPENVAATSVVLTIEKKM